MRKFAMFPYSFLAGESTSSCESVGGQCKQLYPPRNSLRYTREFPLSLKGGAGFILAVALMCSPAFAVKWNVDSATSTLKFQGQQEGETFEGSFQKFTSDIEFDEKAPEKGTIHVTVDMANVTIDGKDRQDALPTNDWFAIKQFPTAEFTSTSIHDAGSDKIGINNYLAKGTLTIRGVAKRVELPFWLKTTGNNTLAKGELTLNRSDFGVGTGQWKSDEWIKYPVRVNFEIHATRTQ